MRLRHVRAILACMRRLFALIAVIPLAFTLPVACDEGPQVLPCGEIPAGGCPVGRGGTCDDPFCATLYDCVDGAWRLAKACPGGTGGSSGGPDAGPMPDACNAVMIDHTGETTGCKPDLQNPDCPAVAAEQCVTSACLTDCIDFYLCRAEGWALVAYCNEEGGIVLTP